MQNLKFNIHYISFQELTMKKIKGHFDFMVAGGAGFIGSHLCEKFIESGFSVLCVDNLFTSKSKDNIKHLLNYDEFVFEEHDINKPLIFDSNYIINLACPASPIHYQMNPVDTIKTNVLGSINLLDQATKKGIPILQASTSEVYGDPEISPQSENYYGNVNPIGPRSCYDEGKRCAEALFFDYNRQFNTKIKVIRIFNTYGPRMRPDDGRVISNFICQALSDSPVTIYGDGFQTRSFCYIDDLIKAIFKMVSKESFQGPVNLGNPEEISIGHVARKIIELTGSNSELIFKELPDDDPKQRKPDISIANKELDWSPSVSLEAGLINTINYFRSTI